MSDSPERDLTEHDFSEHDETLLDAPAHDPPPAARPWLLQQRFIHGLLRAMNTDAGSREARVQAILERIAVRRRPSTWQLLAAALLLALVGWAVIPGFDRLPQAEAAVARAAHELGKQVDRRFHLKVGIDSRQAKGASRLATEFTFTTRPGMRFLIEGTWAFGTFQAGCDGTQLWHRAGWPGSKTVTVPLADAERLLGAMGDVLDLGYLDVAALLQRLPAGFDLRVTGRESLDGLGPQVRVEAEALPERLEERLAAAVLWFDEASGMVSRVELRGQNRSGAVRTVRFDYLGVVALPTDAYAPPR